MQENNENWYVLFSRTGAEERLVGNLKNVLDTNFHNPFILKKTCIFRRHSEKSLFQKICFPGYVFIESVKSTQDFMADAFPIVYKTKDAFRFLSYGRKNDIAMHEKEKIALKRLFGLDHCIDISTGFKEGDLVTITSGSLIGYESKIIKINKNRQQAVISLDIFGTTVPFAVGFEILKRNNVQ